MNVITCADISLPNDNVIAISREQHRLQIAAGREFLKLFQFGGIGYFEMIFAIDSLHFHAVD